MIRLNLCGLGVLLVCKKRVWVEFDVGYLRLRIYMLLRFTLNAIRKFQVDRFHGNKS